MCHLYRLRYTTCTPSGEASGATSTPATNSFDWFINVGLSRYPKPTTFTNLAQTAYDRDGNLPSFDQMLKRYFPASPLQQAQIQIKISQTQISSATFHPACLYIESEANYIVLSQTDINGTQYIYQILTDDAFTVIELLDPSHPGTGFHIRVWKRNAATLQQIPSSIYYDPAPFENSATPLTDVTFYLPAGAQTFNNTLLYTQKETTGVNGTRITTQQVVQTLDPNGLPLTVVSSVYQGADTTGQLLSQENLTYSNRGSKLLGLHHYAPGPDRFCECRRHDGLSRPNEKHPGGLSGLFHQ